ncbi:MAG: hypothetical protein HYS56_01415 [Candidatus Omnitrophica bacterium]|nr:hypothetical protein [Candidatus Omnitrophota bacterium]
MNVTQTNLFCAVLASAVFTSGCATTPVSYSEARPVPLKRVFAPQFLTERAETVKITVKRDSGFTGSACTFSVFLDGSLIAELRGGERVDLYVKPGDHVLSTRVKRNPFYPLWGCGSLGTAEVEVIVIVGQWKSYRIGLGQGGTLQFSPTAF